MKIETTPIASDVFMKLEEFLITGKLPEHRIVDAILTHHLIPLNDCRRELGFPIIISKHSGFRPTEWDVERGRTGNGSHTFGTGNGFSNPAINKGACDVTTSKENMPELFVRLARGPWTRIAYYPKHNFFHIDYMNTTGKSFHTAMFKQTTFEVIYEQVKKNAAS